MPFPFSFWRTKTTATFDPATLLLTGWWRANFSASPWVGTASAGGSGSRDLTEATNPPSTGATINSLTPADFDGTNDVLSNATAISTFLSASGWRMWALVNIDAITTNDASAFNNDIIMTDTGAFWGIHVRANGGSPLVYAYQWDGAEKKASASISTGAWTLIQARYDGTNIRLKVNNGTVQTAAAGNILTTTGSLQVGKNAAFPFNGRMADLGLVASAGADADFDNIRTYVNARYGLSV